MVVIVTGHAGSPAVASARSILSPDEALVLVAARGAEMSAKLMVADASSLQRLADSWAALVSGTRTKVVGVTAVAAPSNVEVRQRPEPAARCSTRPAPWR